MDILLLSTITIDDIKHLGHNGYVSNKFYEVNISDNHATASFVLRLKNLEVLLKKNWITTDQDIEYYNQIIAEGHSFGAFKKEELVGIIICNERKWNNTLYIENILVSELQRGKGIGGLLIKKIIRHSLYKNNRLIELETQNTNMPAIQFYKKQGFKITGLNLTLYNTKGNIEEVAIYMTYNFVNAEIK